MDTSNRSLDRQILFWSGLGPFVLLLTFLVALVKLSATWFYVPGFAVLGLPACWYWRQSGLAATLLLLLITAGVLYASLPLDERFWLVGLSMAVGLGLVVSHLSGEEIQALTSGMEKESRSRYENLLRLDEKLQAVQEEWHEERDLREHQMTQLKAELAQAQGTLASYEALLPRVEADLEAAQAKRDRLLEELWRNRQDRALTEQQLQDAQLENKGLTDAYAMSQTDREKACHQRIAELERAMAQADDTFIRLQQELDGLDASDQKHRQQVEELEQYLEDLGKQKKALEGNCESLTDSLNRHQHRLKVAEEQNRLLNEQLELAAKKPVPEPVQQPSPTCASEETVRALEEEKAELDRRARRWEAMYRQLRDQFEEKTRVLAHTRSELFHTENQLLGLQREIGESQVSESEESLQRHLASVLEELREIESQNENTENAYEELVAGLMRELAEARAS